MTAVEYILLGLRERKNPFFVKYLKHRRVLDIGAGRGEFLALDPVNFVGVDVDPALVAHCCERGMQVHCMSAFALDFPDASFDAIHAAQLIEHFSPTEAAQFLGEASRVLQPGGIVYLTTPGIRNVWNTFSHIRPYPPDSFKKLLNSDTENYIRKSRLGLVFEGAWGARYYFENKGLMFVCSILDLVFPPNNPIGWKIVLRKHVGTSDTLSA